jgi:hypothetical protein
VKETKTKGSVFHLSLHCLTVRRGSRGTMGFPCTQTNADIYIYRYIYRRWRERLSSAIYPLTPFYWLRKPESSETLNSKARSQEARGPAV